MTDSSHEDDWDEEPWGAYRDEIRRRLDAIRPDRSISDDKDWREPVYGWARNHIPNESGLIRHFAETEVDRQEASATRRGNKLVRQWVNGQRPLLWSDLGPLPCTIAKTRIRFDALTPDDMEDWALERLAEGKAVYDEVVLLSEAGLDLARRARRLGFSTVAEIGDLPPQEHGESFDEEGDDPFGDEDE